MVRQQTVVHEPEVAPIAGRPEAAFDLMHQRDRAQRWQAGTNLQGHVHGAAFCHAASRPVWYRRMRPWLAPGTGTATTPAGTRSQRKLELGSVPSHGS